MTSSASENAAADLAAYVGTEPAEKGWGIVDLTAHQRLDLAPCPRADLLQAAAGGADDDRLLAAALDVDVGVDLGEPVLGDHLLDEDRDRVGQLVAYPFQRRLADQLGDHDLLGLVGDHALGVELRRLGQVADQYVDQRRQVVAGDRADRHDVGEVAELTDGLQLGGQAAPVDQVGLGHDGDHACFEPLDFAGDEPVAPADLLVGGQAEPDHVDLAPGLAHEVVEAFAEQGPRAVQPGRVHEDELGVGAVQDAADGVPGRLRLGRGDGDLLADDRVGERGLARVRPPHEAREPRAVGRAHLTAVGGAHLTVPRSEPSGAATWIGASTDRSRTAARPNESTVDASVTTAAASSLLAPAAAALATASCSADSPSEGRFTLAAAYVRPSPSRTAAPSMAPVRARAERARTTSFSSSVDSSGIGRLPLLA